MFDNLIDATPTRGDFLAEVIAGLRSPEKALPCKYFYDEKGSLLFDAICETEEYYPTRTELGIMEQSLPQMAEAIGSCAMLIEYGSGTSHKTRMLLSRLKSPAAYVPIDICREHLIQAAHILERQFPGLTVLPVCADYMSTITLPKAPDHAKRKVIYFPGSTIGNFYPSQAEAFLTQAAEICGPGGGMLIGVDLRKDTRILEKAYNDQRGLTAGFNLNLLTRINAELGADFRLDQFAHQAIYNTFRGRIEMHLISCRPQKVHVGGETISFQKNESILTECSYKYDIDQFALLAETSGWRQEQIWTDPDQYFSVQYLSVQSHSTGRQTILPPIAQPV